MKKLISISVAAAAALLLLACAGPFGQPSSVRTGDTRAAVIARLGQPARVVALPAGERLQYSGQPFGQFAYMVDVDAAGRVSHVRQVLNLEDFNRIEPGAWNRADVEREFGPPAKVDRVSSWNGDVMTYRWRDHNNDMFYWVYLDPRGTVGRAHQGIEFINAPDRD